MPRLTIRFLERAQERLDTVMESAKACKVEESTIIPMPSNVMGVDQGYLNYGDVKRSFGIVSQLIKGAHATVQHRAKSPVFTPHKDRDFDRLQIESMLAQLEYVVPKLELAQFAD